MAYESWDAIAEMRVIRILARERVMSQHMLESKISESGPLSASALAPSKQNQRAEPPHITTTLRKLLRAGAVLQLPASLGPSGTTLYADTSYSLGDPSPSDLARLHRVTQAYGTWTGANSRARLCGQVLERVVHAAALDAGTVTVVGEPGRQVRIPVNGISLPASPPDHVLGVGRELILVEDKNRRSWIYPSRIEVWTLLDRCLQADCALPILVTRKVPPALLSFFDLIGALAFQTNNQLFAAELRPPVHQAFALVVGKDGLNFHDIRFEGTAAADALQGRLTRFFANTVPHVVSRRRLKFRDSADVLRFFLNDAGGPGGIDQRTSQACIRALRTGELPGDELEVGGEPDYDEPDY